MHYFSNLLMGTCTCKNLLNSIFDDGSQALVVTILDCFLKLLSPLTFNLILSLFRFIMLWYLVNAWRFRWFFFTLNKFDNVSVDVRLLPDKLKTWIPSLYLISVSYYPASAGIDWCFNVIYIFFLNGLWMFVPFNYLILCSIERHNCSNRSNVSHIFNTVFLFFICNLAWVLAILNRYLILNLDKGLNWHFKFILCRFAGIQWYGLISLVHLNLNTINNNIYFKNWNFLLKNCIINF